MNYEEVNMGDICTIESSAREYLVEQVFPNTVKVSYLDKPFYFNRKDIKIIQRNDTRRIKK